eukprot:11202603-Lingulodinium_polyedra.AAC.1
MAPWPSAGGATVGASGPAPSRVLCFPLPARTATPGLGPGVPRATKMWTCSSCVRPRRSAPPLRSRTAPSP